ncbi:SOS response-associated peptidase [Burkholderia cepacia]|uniref:SOS response-associated peptidase n=1 Tax=Burkholderia cepacia TaxID=292 RepID=UPI002019745A|nr:SOS response-associated peptidase family protein [Burkholderia cepacia]UQO35518.1 SOS response-associated peptidase [Burkholderia cepacia]UQO45830.1 SOS response-associated peptidase [Burkholderia cepacia]UQP10914.1 SOS response-associated peptidase [Burkholderia cepacia]
MCTNYKAPDEDPGINELKVGIGDLYHRDPWELDVYPDYAAPIAWADGDGLGVVKAVFGFWPKFMQPDRVDDNGKKRRKLDTFNARSETVGESRLYGKAWRAGQRCLIPVRWIYEPCYETGRNVWHRIGLADWKPYCVAGIWRRYDGDDGRTLIGMSMLTVNADGHAVMGRMHKPGDEKRSVVILRPTDYDEWLHTTNVEAARSILQLYPVKGMHAEPK